MNNHLYQIPQILYQKHSDFLITSKNTFCEYSIHMRKNSVYVCYGGGRYKEFKSIEEAKNWIEYSHYPTKIASFLTRVRVPKGTPIYVSHHITTGDPT